MSQGSPASRSRYLAEWYQPAMPGARLEQTVARIGQSAAELSADGSAVHVLLTLFMPHDEVTFCLFAAESPALVEQACRGAGMPVSRITRAITIPEVTRQSLP